MKVLNAFLGVIFIMSIFSCSTGKMAIKKGNKRLKYGEYEYSIEYYNKAIAKNYHIAEANFKIGEAYRLSNRIAEAQPFYNKAIELGYENEAVHYYYGLALKNNTKYEQAKQVLNSYAETGSDQTYIDLALREVDNLNELEVILSKKSFFRVKNLSGINTPAAEYSPIYRDGELYFTSSRYGGKIYKATGTSFTNLYKVKTKGARVDTTTIEPLSDMINSPNTNDGCITFSPDGRTMVFAKGNSGRRKGADDVDLYISRYRRSGWSKPELLRLNDRKAWDSTPAFSRDGRTLYFSSNRRGGHGGTDLYAATKNRRGRFSNVRNLGTQINTPREEMFPYAGIDGVFYFASSGHAGLGGLDVFAARRIEGKMKIENLGPPLNSNADDFGFFLYTPDKGFYSSNREGSKGDDDVYTFINNDPDLKIVNYYLTGVTYSIDDDGNETILPNTTVKLFGANNELLNEGMTSREGKFRFRVYPEEDYIIMGEKPDYFTSRALFTTKGKSIPKDQLKKLVTNKIFSSKVVLSQIVLNKSIVLENIYYDLDKWNIRPDAAMELDKLVTVLLDNPEIKIELSSHTDSRAPADYNDDLSKKRARSAVDYIVSKGVDPGRITAKGYGESLLIVSDEDIDRIETEEEKEKAHQRNRRTEFKVTEYKKIREKEISDDQLEELKAEESIESDENDLENKIDWDN